MASEFGRSDETRGHNDPIDHQHGDPLQPNSPWAKQNVLTFGMTLAHILELKKKLADLADGGGVRGYYSLLLLSYLMKHIHKAEELLDEPRSPTHTHNLSSFSPCEQPRDSSYSPTPESRFLPCHYFDYISGTSTGAYVTVSLARGTDDMYVTDYLQQTNHNHAHNSSHVSG